MSDINLLPDNLRDQEERERQKAQKKSYVEDLELSQPAVESSNLLLNRSDKPKESFWSKIFGSAKPIKVDSQQLNIPSFRPQPDQRIKSNFLVKSQKPAPKLKVKPIFSEPEPPYSTTTTMAPENNQSYWQHKKSKSSEKKGGSWWRSLIAFFLGESKRSSGVKFDKQKTDFREINVNNTEGLKVKSSDQKIKIKSKSGFWRSLALWLGLGREHKADRDRVSNQPIDFSKSLDQNHQHPKSNNKIKFDFEDKLRPQGFLSRLFANNNSSKKIQTATSASLPKSSFTAHVESKQKPIKPQGQKINEPENLAYLNINLVPEELLSFKKRTHVQQISLILLFLLVPALMVFALYQFLGYQTAKYNLVFEEKKNILSQLAVEVESYQNKQIKPLFLKSKLLAVADILSWQNKWINFFDALERHTLDRVSYTNLIADDSGNITLPAVARDNLSGDGRVDHYFLAAQQIANFQQAEDFIKEVRVDNIKLNYSPRGGVDGVAFKLNLIMVDDFLKD